MKENKKEYKIWLTKAGDDLLWTKSNIKADIYYGACFTSQQSAEKSLKAYLLYQKGRFDKIHDLVKLIDDCIKYDKSFSRYRKKTAKLSFYYIQTRYPDISELDRFTQKEAEEAFINAKEIFDFVSDKINKPK